MAKKNAKSLNGFGSDHLFPFVLLLPLLFLPPFFRGLFFDSESFVAYMYAAAVLMVYVMYRKDNFKLSFNLMEAAFIGFVLAWFISILAAYDVREAVGDALRNLNYLIIFLLLAALAENLQKMRLALWTFFVAGIGVALTGLGTAYGTFNFNGAFVDGLINSTLQYHNAAAIYLMACGIIGLYLAAVSENLWLRYAVSAGNFLVLLTAFGAGSRGAMLMGPIAFALFFIGVPGLRIKTLISLLAAAIPFALLSSRLLDFNNLSLPWLFLFIGMFLTSAIHLGLDKAVGRLSLNIDRKQVWTVVTVVFLALGAVLFIFSEQIMPQGISDRLHNFDFQQNSVQERFTFYKDAMKIIKDHPLLGTGGGGWNAVYRQYQSYLYHSTEVHNHPLQVWVETGTIGFVFFILLWLAGVVTIIQIYRSALPTEYKALAWTAFCAAIALGLHSLIDFSLSEGAVSILLWGQFGLIRAVQKRLDKQPEAIVNYRPVARKVLGGVVAVAFFVSSLLLFIGDRYGIKAAEALRYGNITDGRAALEQAVKFDPLNARLRVQLAQVYSYEAAQNKNYYLNGAALREAEEAIKWNPTNAENYWVAAQAASGTGQVAEMVRYAEKAVELAPLVQANYEQLAVVYLNAGKMYLDMKQPGRAKEYLEKIEPLLARMEKIMATKNEVEKRFWKGPLLGPSDRFNQVKTEADRLLKQL
ncbi:O-antigen ligase family protein [Thermincola potens]|uniref:O-antigen polymerase n=1 Tax=Thermincola potens (strain JR) TaxID=635013 RepID=D5XD08_THEPJ|nr:O-antigen ligase family protein [Thermincola potens]ADG83684.1 O-antigen polymerase [Thermincola potens JR]